MLRGAIAASGNVASIAASASAEMEIVTTLQIWERRLAVAVQGLDAATQRHIFLGVLGKAA
jgi:hypothetical protein